MSPSLTPCQENYLEHIYCLAREGVPVRVRDIADAAGVRMPSVTRALGRLAEAGLVVHQRYGSVEITEQGRSAAEAIRQRHHCVHTLLVDLLAMTEDQASAEICRLEHVLSQEVLARLEVLFDHALSPGSADWREELQAKLRRHCRRRGQPGIGGTGIGSANLHVQHGAVDGPEADTCSDGAG